MAGTRKIAAILVADIVGYSRLAGTDEDRILARLRALRSDLIDPTIAVHSGRVVKRTGDGCIVEFRSTVDAVRCAVEVQSGMSERNAGVPNDRQIVFRIGVHVGDVVEESDGDLMGDAVNVAARLEGACDPGGIVLSEDVYRQVRDKLGEEFADLGDKDLKNIRHPIRCYAIVQAGGRGQEDAPERAALPLPSKPSIAVLPFQNMSGDPEQDYFADGIVEDVTTGLSRIKWLFVIARNSSFVYKGKAVDVRPVGRELGVRYLLEGGVRKAGPRVRITVQLVEAETGAHLWADRFDGALEDIFDFQDKVAIDVAGVIEPALQAAEVRRSAARPTNDLTAYDLYLRALATFYPITKERLLKVLELLEEAIAIDPHCGPALSLAAMCQMRLVRESWAEAPETASRKAVDLARQALQVAGDDPGILANAAFVLANFGEEIDGLAAGCLRRFGPA